MVYSNKFVTCVLINKQPQKELANSVVPIPFGSEYSLRFRNKNNRRAVVKFWIDGENVSGNGYVISANSSVDIERHFDKNVKFKFVNLDSSEAVDFGKNGPNLDGEKGVVEVRFYLEKEYKYPVYSPTYYTKDLWWGTSGHSYGASSGSFSSNSILRSKSIGASGVVSNDITKSINLVDSIPTLSDSVSLSVGSASLSSNTSLQEGCTVEGSISDQKFSSTYIDLEEDYVEMKLVLKGYDIQENTHVRTVGISSGGVGEGMVQNELFCTSCGNKRKHTEDRKSVV